MNKIVYPCSIGIVSSDSHRSKGCWWVCPPQSFEHVNYTSFLKESKSNSISLSLFPSRGSRWSNVWVMSGLVANALKFSTKTSSSWFCITHSWDFTAKANISFPLFFQIAYSLIRCNYYYIVNIPSKYNQLTVLLLLLLRNFKSFQ